jgi:hypothetical protein
VLKNKSKYSLFKDWDIIIKKKAKLIADNYRIKALKEYLCYLKLSKNK